MVRLHYIDNLRWICILLLFPLHAALVFCPQWYGYYVSSDYSSTVARGLVVSVESWIMPLLFCIAGLSMKFALQERTSLLYLKERVTKLLVPFLAGLVLICPVIAYYALKFHTGYTGSFFGAFVHFFSTIQNIQDRNGIFGDFSVEHLWFIIFLFIISVFALGIILLGRRHITFHLNSTWIRFPVLVLLFIPVWLLNGAGFEMAEYSFLSYFALFLIGYYLFARDFVQAELEKYWAILLAACIILTIGMMWIYGIVLAHNEVLWGSSVFYVLTGWVGVLALMGTGRHLFDIRNAFATYMGAASYPVYILHQAILVAIAYYVVMLAIPPALQFTAIVVVSLLFTFACYEILKRIPGIRVLFGIIVPIKKKV